MNIAPTAYNLTAAAGAIEDLVTVFVDNLEPAIEDCEDMYGIPAERLVDLRANEVIRRRLARALVGRLLTSGDVVLEPTKLSQQ